MIPALAVQVLSFLGLLAVRLKSMADSVMLKGAVVIAQPAFGPEVSVIKT